jgi:DNA repair protein RecN (Recombination protein N)
MFEELRICGLGSINETVLELHPGLTVLSGETGAGKSSVVRAFALLAGGRADPAQVRSGRSQAVVEARLRVDPAGAVAATVRELGGELECGSLLVARTVSADGRSRAFVGGRAVPVSQLGELVGRALALHGQSSQLQLRHAGAQRAALDRFAGAPVLEPLARYEAVREQWLQARREQQTLREREAEHVREAELLRLGLADVERVAPVPGEDLELDRELSRLGAADELRCASESARSALAGSEVGGSDDAGALRELNFAARVLEAASGNDSELGALAARVHEVRVLAGDLAADLAAYAEGVDDDPQRLALAQERRAELNRLCRPHGTGVDEVLQWASDAEHRLLELDVDGARGAALAERESAAAETLLALAAQVSSARVAAARVLRRRVTAELSALSMSTACLEVAVHSRLADLASLGPEGGDEVELLFSAGEGMSLRPLARAASGGELSRVVLALEVVLAAGLGPPTMVFDEVDAGIGGEAALEVGARLARLASSRQVICVTHLSQVAAFADRHLLVAKIGRGASVHSTVTSLGEQSRLRELSRMLGGVSDSELAQGHAAELLASADRAKSGPATPRSATAGLAGVAKSGRRRSRATPSRVRPAAGRAGPAERVTRGAA